MTEQLYRATVRGVPNVLISKGTYKWHSVQEIEADKQIFPNGYFTDHNDSDLTDLRPVKVVDMDAVVIDLKDYGRIALAEFEDLFRFLGNNFQNGWIKNIRDQIASQLSTPAEPATGGGMESPTHETTEISSTSLGSPKCNCGLEYSKHQAMVSTNCDFLTVPPSPKGVTIELTETEKTFAHIWLEDVKSLLANHPIRLDLLNKFIDSLQSQLYSQLTPRMDEPKTKGQILREVNETLYANRESIPNLAELMTGISEILDEIEGVK